MESGEGAASRLMTTALAWIPKRAHPLFAEGKKRMEEMRAKAGMGEEEPTSSDDEADVEEEGGINFFSQLDGDRKLLEEKDPYMDKQMNVEGDELDLDEVKEDDMMFVTANADQDVCSLEVYLYDPIEGGLFVHHDILLNNYPLALQWIEGNHCAVGTFDSAIELWSLDADDSITEPVGVLGVKKEELTAKKKRSGASRKKKSAGNADSFEEKKKTSHTDAVMCLSSSPHAAHVLASGSADHSVKIWDLESTKCVQTYSHHSEKIQMLKFHPLEQGILLTGAYDSKIGLVDCRLGSSPEHMKNILFGSLPADCETALWRRHAPQEALVACEDGQIVSFDVRNLSAPLWTFQAHDIAVTGLTDSMGSKNLLVSSSQDGYAKVWDLSASSGSPPTLCYERNLNVGPLFCLAANEEAETSNYMVFGGQVPALWDLTDCSVVRSAFPTLPGAEDEREGEVRRMEAEKDEDAEEEKKKKKASRSG